MGKEGSRRIYERVLTTLNASSGFLQARLTEIETAFGETAGFLELPQDRDMYHHDPTYLHIPQKLPALFFFPRSNTNAGILQGKRDITHVFELRVYAAHTKADILVDKLAMYQRAIEKALEDRVRTGGDIYQIVWRTGIYSPLTPWLNKTKMVQGIASLGEFSERVERPTTV